LVVEAAGAEAVVVEAAGAAAVVAEAAGAPPGDTRLDFVLLWHSAGIVAVAARRRKRTGRSFICSPLGQETVRVSAVAKEDRLPAGV
jgi:hypothetical protein